MKLAARIKFILRLVAGYAAAAAVGYGASRIHLPLAWVLGPLVASAAVSLAGVQLPAPIVARRAGQLLIGCTIGLGITSAVVAGLAQWLPVMLLTALLSVLVSSTFSVALAHFSGIDGKTAYFAVLPGGLSEMGNIGASIGARIEAIALIQALRVAVVVLLIPPLMVSQGLFQTAIPRPDLPYVEVALSLVISFCGAYFVSLARLNNPWMVGALIATACLTAAGLADGRMPPVLFALGQLLVGYSIGTRFQRDALRKLHRVAAVAMIVVLGMIAVMVLYAGALAQFLGLDFATAVLSASPGGTAEMAATAQALHLPVALISAFHVTRSVLVNGFAVYYWRGLSATGYLAALERILQRLSKKE